MYLLLEMFSFMAYITLFPLSHKYNSSYEKSICFLNIYSNLFVQCFDIRPYLFTIYDLAILRRLVLPLFAFTKRAGKHYCVPKTFSLHYSLLERQTSLIRGNCNPGGNRDSVTSSSSFIPPPSSTS